MFLFVFITTMLACFVGVVRPYTTRFTRRQFAWGMVASYIGLIVCATPRKDVLPILFTHAIIVALAGVIHPYVRNSKRWHFGLAALASLIGVGVTVPPLTPQEIAARKAEEEQEAREKAQEEQTALAREAAAEHQLVVKKAQGALQAPTSYTRADYGDTYERVGPATFAKLNGLEPGAAYAAAESRSCNTVTDAMVSDMSSKGAAVWFVNCENGNRFMIDQNAAAAALERFQAGKLARRTLEASCTLNTVAMCKATPAQRAAKDKEIEYVTACDAILEMALVSPSSLDKHRWSYGFGQGNTMIVERTFDSQNAFGAMIRGRYRCEIDLANDNVKGFRVDGPTGSKRII